MVPICSEFIMASIASCGVELGNVTSNPIILPVAEIYIYLPSPIGTVSAIGSPSIMRTCNALTSGSNVSETNRLS